MKQKINSRFIFLAVTSILITTIVLTFVFYEMLERQVFQELNNYSQIVLKSRQVEDNSIENIRLTIVDGSGNVVFDSLKTPETMENHLTRPEISLALKNGTATVIRKSETLSVSLFYHAVKLEDGSVLRVGKRSKNVFAIFLSVIPVTCGIIILLLVLSIFLSHFLTKNIIGPIEKMADNIDDFNFASGYEELIPFAKKIRSQHDTILSAVNMRQEFTANVSHELKTPLTAISGYSELIEGGIADERQIKHFAMEINKNSKRLLDLINDIIKLSELDSLSDDRLPESSDINEILKETVKILQMEADNRGVRLDYTGPAGNPKSVIPLAKEYGRELCYNLVQNAIRYNKPNGIVHVLLENSPNEIKFTVRDTGIGIPQNCQERIFERFYRVDKSRSKELGGTGLGLAIVKHIAEISGAVLYLQSKEGSGTTISVTFKV